jgi:hypothetical protein
MPRLLRRLKIDEVSSVDNGAGEGAKIVIMKRIGGSEPHEERSMPRAEEPGVIYVAKRVVSENKSYSITEAEFTKLIHDHVQGERREGESPEQAFARCFTADTDEGRLIRKAHAVIKNFPQMASLEPLVVGGAAARSQARTSPVPTARRGAAPQGALAARWSHPWASIHKHYSG